MKIFLPCDIIIPQIIWISHFCKGVAIMIDIWEFANAKKVKLTTIKGKTYIGYVVCIFDKEENGSDSDDITIQCSPDFIIGFTPDEIEEITVIE